MVWSIQPAEQVVNVDRGFLRGRGGLFRAGRSGGFRCDCSALAHELDRAAAVFDGVIPGSDPGAEGFEFGKGFGSHENLGRGW